MAKKYMAYAGSYSYTGEAKGITVYDVDIQKGFFKKRCEIDVDNSSYVIVSHDRKTLYSIADEGVVAFRILENGAITRLNSANIRGMRGCHLSIDHNNKFLFVSGYHDGKITVMTLNPDGSVGHIADGVYHHGLGSITERNFRPHVSCTKITPDGNFVLAADLGLDHVKIYKFSHANGKLALADILPCDINSAPRTFRFSKDGRFLYLMYEQKNVIDVFSYSYESGKRAPDIEKIQTVSSSNGKHSHERTAATCIKFTSDNNFLFCANAGENSVSLYKRDSQSGLLEPRFCLPISGEYPKDIAVFPDDRHIASINHESGTITFFTVDYENSLLIMSSNGIKVNQPNSCVIMKV